MFPGFLSDLAILLYSDRVCNKEESNPAAGSLLVFIMVGVALIGAPEFF